MSETKQDKMEKVINKAKSLVEEYNTEKYEQIANGIANMMKDAMIERDTIIDKWNKKSQKYEDCKKAFSSINQLQQDESLSTSQQEAVDAIVNVFPTKDMESEMASLHEEIQYLDRYLERIYERIDAIMDMDVEEEVRMFKERLMNKNDESNHQVANHFTNVIDYGSLNCKCKCDNSDNRFLKLKNLFHDFESSSED